MIYGYYSTNPTKNSTKENLAPIYKTSKFASVESLKEYFS